MKRLLPLLISFALLAVLETGSAEQITPVSYYYTNGFIPYGPPEFLDYTGKLTDGQYSSIIPGDSLGNYGWVQFGGAGEPVFIFTQGVTITNIVLSMANWTPAAVYLPDLIKINGVDYNNYGGIFPDKDRAFISLDGNWSNTDISILFSHAGYLEMDEVLFFGTVAPVPEPSTWALLGMGGLLLAGWRRRG